MSLVERTYSLVVYGFLAVGFAIVLLFAYWWFWPYEVVDTKPTPFEIVLPYHVEPSLPTVEQGGLIVYQFDYVKHTDVIPTVNRRFIDGLVFSEGMSKPTILAKGSGTARVEVRVPETLPPGAYRIEIVRFYEMNPVRTIKIVSNTERFVVTEKAHDE